MNISCQKNWNSNDKNVNIPTITNVIVDAEADVRFSSGLYIAVDLKLLI